MTKEDLKIVFFGTPDFAVESLASLVDNGFNVVSVVTMPDKAAGRGQKLAFSPVKKYALEHNLPLLQPTRLKDDDFVDALRALDADLFIVIAFRMLPEVVWAMPPLGTFNLHASLLPLYRGAAPINRAVMNGDSRTGVTTFFLKHEIDTGDVIDRVSIDIAPYENAGSVHDRLMKIGADLTVSTVNSIIAGNLKTTPQDELLGDAEPTPAPKIFKDDCRIDWQRSAGEVHNHVRGLAPYPAAWSMLHAGGDPVSVKVLETSIFAGDTNLAPGQVALVDKKTVLAACADGTAVQLVSIQPAGKRPMAAADYIRGLHLADGQMIYFG